MFDNLFSTSSLLLHFLIFHFIGTIDKNQKIRLQENSFRRIFCTENLRDFLVSEGDLFSLISDFCLTFIIKDNELGLCKNQQMFNYFSKFYEIPDKAYPNQYSYHQNQKTPFLKMEMNGVVLMSIKICCEKKVPNRLHFLKWSQELFADFFDFIEKR